MTYTLGMAVLLAASGTKGRRLCTPHASFRLSISGVEGSLQGQAEDIHVETSQMLRDMDRVEKEFSAITGQRIEKIRKDFRRDFYLSPAMAVKYGLIDTILAPDEGKGTKLERGIRDPWSGAVVKPVVAFGRFADPQQPRSAA